jgi:dihydropteroate synthase
VIEALAARFDVVLSIDTSSAAVITACAGLGAGLINDVRALTRPGALSAAAASGLPVCLMHMQGEPGTMQDAPAYRDVVGEVSDYLRDRIAACVQHGIGRERLLVDPGFGFGKTLQHNLVMLNALERFSALELPLLVGLSRKRMLGTITGKAEKERVAGGLAAAVIAVMKGASIVRTHDVPETVDALKVCQQVLHPGS